MTARTIVLLDEFKRALARVGLDEEGVEMRAVHLCLSKDYLRLVGEDLPSDGAIVTLLDAMRVAPDR